MAPAGREHRVRRGAFGVEPLLVLRAAPRRAGRSLRAGAAASTAVAIPIGSHSMRGLCVPTEIH